MKVLKEMIFKNSKSNNFNKTISSILFVRKKIMLCVNYKTKCNKKAYNFKLNFNFLGECTYVI